MKKSLFIVVLILSIVSCKNNSKSTSIEKIVSKKEAKYPSDIMPFMDEWKILLGDGTRKENLLKYKKEDFFYVENDGVDDWVVYKTPNSGITSKN